MKHTLKCAVVLMFSMNVLESPAQFYTTEKVGPAADTLSISTVSVSAIAYCSCNSKYVSLHPNNKSKICVKLQVNVMNML